MRSLIVKVILSTLAILLLGGWWNQAYSSGLSKVAREYCQRLTLQSQNEKANCGKCPLGAGTDLNCRIIINSLRIQHLHVLRPQPLVQRLNQRIIQGDAPVVAELHLHARPAVAVADLHGAGAVTSIGLEQRLERRRR